MCMRYVCNQRLICFLQPFLRSAAVSKNCSPDDCASDISSALRMQLSSYSLASEVGLSSSIGAVRVPFLSRRMLVRLVVELSEKTRSVSSMRLFFFLRPLSYLWVKQFSIPMMMFPWVSRMYFLASWLNVNGLKIVDLFVHLLNFLLDHLHGVVVHRYGLSLHSKQQYISQKSRMPIIIRMLNPFAIEKELFAKTDALSGMLTLLKGVIATSIVRKQDRRAYPKAFIRECLDVMENMEAKSKLYVCKVCGKKFNEGRQLGGHVSRAHKGSQSSILDQDSDTESIRPKRNKASVAVRRGRRDPESSYVEEDDSEPEVYVPRMSKRRARVLSLEEEEEETGLKKMKVQEAIFYEDS